MSPPLEVGVAQMPGRLEALFLVGSLAVCTRVMAASLEVTVSQADDRPLVGAVVTAQNESTPLPPAAPERVIIDQINLTFVPDLVVLPVGSTVEFPNSDTVSHQIYSFSPAKRFQLPLYRGKPYPPVSFDAVGVVTLGCNIHDQMLAYVVVTDAPYFGRTDAAGVWSAELAHGHYKVNLWHPRLRDEGADLERQLTVSEGDRAELTLRLVKPLQPAPLERPHSWDY